MKQIFPDVSGYEKFVAAVADKEEIRTLSNCGLDGYKVVNYMVSTPTTFDSPIARECRGIVFNEDGMVVARPLHKFFNLNQQDGARPEDFNWSKLMRVMDKRDGSMIHTVLVGANSPFKDCIFDVKSKQSFISEVAVAARKLLLTKPNYVAFCNEMALLDKTAIFEFTSPQARIVLDYDEDELVLLHVRDNLSGDYMSPGEISFRASMHNVKTVTNDESGRDDLFAEMLSGDRDPQAVWKAVMKLHETVEGIEGWIFQFEDGEMVKVKTKWYMDRHGLMTDMRERDLHRSVLDEAIDDIKAAYVQEGIDITEVLQIEKQVNDVLTGMLHEMDAIVKQDGALDKRAFFEKWGPQGAKYKCMKALVRMYEGKPDIAADIVKHWYRQEILPTVSLRRIIFTESIAEAE